MYSKSTDAGGKYTLEEKKHYEKLTKPLEIYFLHYTIS